MHILIGVAIRLFLGAIFAIGFARPGWPRTYSGMGRDYPDKQLERPDNEGDLL